MEAPVERMKGLGRRGRRGKQNAQFHVRIFSTAGDHTMVMVSCWSSNNGDAQAS